MRHENYLRRVKAVQDIVREHYEPGRLDRCYSEVWRRWVYPQYPMSQRTFYRLLKIDLRREQTKMQEAKSKPPQADYSFSLFPEL